MTSYDGGLPPEPLIVTPVGDEVQLGCRWCDATTRVLLEPTAVLLSRIDEFVATHAQCQTASA